MLMFLQSTLNFAEGAAGQLPGVTAETAKDPGLGFGNLISTLLSGMITVAALLLLMYLLWGALDWINSGGEKGKVEKAREKMTQGVLGLIVMAATIAIFLLVQDFLGLEIFIFTSK